MRTWACTCGAELMVSDACPARTWQKLVRAMEAEHAGPGHGRCEPQQAGQARRQAERKGTCRATQSN